MRSASSPRAVSITTGTRLDFRMSVSASMPVIFGIITSSTTSWHDGDSAAATPVSASCAMVTSKPSPSM